MSIISFASKVKKTLTALVGAALVAGSLTAVAPASADVTSTMKQPKASQTLGTPYQSTIDYGDLVSRGDWIYSMQGPGDQYYYGANPSATPPAGALRRTSATSFPAGTSYQILGMDRNDSNKAATSGSVTKAYQPYVFDVTPDGNTAYILDRIFNNSGRVRLLRVDLSAATDTSADLTADVVATLSEGNYPRSITAVSDSTVVIGFSTTAYKMTKSGSTYSFGSMVSIAGGGIFDSKLDADGNVLFALTNSNTVTLATYNPSTMSLVGTATQVSVGSGEYVYQPSGIAIDPATGDVLYVDSNGTRIRRIAKTAGGYATSPTFEAVAGAEKYSATAFAASTTANSYDVTVTGSTAGISVGSNVGFSNVTASQGAYVSSGYSSGMYVSAVNGQVVTIYASSTPFTVSGGTFVSADFFVQAPLKVITALNVNPTQGLLAIEGGSQSASPGSAAYGPRITNFKTHALPMPLSSMSLSAGHKSVSINISGSQFISDLASYEIRIFSGSTLVEAVNAATAHATDGTLVCSSGSGQLYSNFNKGCNSTGLTPNTYYAVAVKMIALDGTVFWNVPGPNYTAGGNTQANAAAGQVLDRTTTATLPVDPDPAGPASPGFAHQGPTSTTALDLLGSAYAHFTNSDGHGGRFVAYYVGNDQSAEVKIVHVKSTGDVDTAFGTSGVMTLGAQSSTSSQRYAQVGWYANGKAFYTDFDATNNKYNFDFGTNAWTLTVAEAKAFCVANITGVDTNATSAGNITLIPSSATDPIVMVTCNAAWRSSNSGQVSIPSVPVFAKVTADHTLTAFAKPFESLNSFDTVSGSTDAICGSLWSYTNNVISDPAPAANGTLFTVLYKGAALTGTAPYKRCPDSWQATYASQSIVVKTDGTVSVVANNLPYNQNNGTPTIGFSGVTADHNSYFLSKATYNSPNKLYRLNNSGVLDTTFGSAGSISYSAPICAGTLSKAIGFTTDADGNTYLTGLALPSGSNMGMNQNSGSKVYLFGSLIQKANANTAEIGSSFISAPVQFSYVPNINPDSATSDFGQPYFESTMDAAGNAFVNYYTGSAGIKSIKFDSFSGDLASGEDYLVCPPAPFEQVNASAPFMGMNTGSVIRTGDNTFFSYNFNNSSKDAYTFTVGANNNLKGGTFTTVEDSIDNHQSGWLVALADGKVLVGGGAYTDYDNVNYRMVTRNVRTIELYDPSATAGSRWTKLTGAGNATNLLPDETREDAHAVLLSNGKVLLYGGMSGQNSSDAAQGGKTTGLVITITGTTAEVSAPIELGATYSNAIPAGTGKWLLFGNAARLSMANVAPTATTKIFNEAGTVTAGPSLGGPRIDPAVVAISGGKYLIIGDNIRMMGPNPVTTPGTFDTFDPAGNAGAGAIVTSASKMRTVNGMSMPAYYQLAGGAALLPSGKILLFPRVMGMQSQPAGLMDPATGNVTAADTPAVMTTDVDLFRVGDKVLIAGGSSMGSIAPWQIYTQPAEAQNAVSADVRKVLKGTSGNIVFNSTTVLTQGSGATALQVKYQNGTGNVLKAPVSVTGAAKLKLDATGRILTTALPTAAQMNGSAGTVFAIILQGSNEIGRVTITYLETKENPVFQGQIQPDVVNPVPGQLANINLSLTAVMGNGTPTLSYKSNTTKVCTVSATGAVTRVARGACEIAVSQAGDLGTNAATKKYKFDFQKSTVSLAFANTVPAAGNIDLTEDDIPLAIIATVDGQPAPGLDVAFDISADDKCAIDDDGVFNTLAVGSCVVTASFAGTADLNAATSITRQYNIVVPSVAVEPEGTVGGVIGDAVFEAKDDATDTMLTVSTTVNKLLPKTIKLGRGWKIVYTPVVKNNAVASATLAPSITSTVIGQITTTFLVPKTAFAKAPTGWKVVGNNYSCALAVYGSKTQVAANKKIKTVVSKGKTCALPALTAPVQVKVKNNWVRLAQKKGSAALTPQRRTAKLNIQ